MQGNNTVFSDLQRASSGMVDSKMCQLMSVQLLHCQHNCTSDVDSLYRPCSQPGHVFIKVIDSYQLLVSKRLVLCFLVLCLYMQCVHLKKYIYIIAVLKSKHAFAAETHMFTPRVNAGCRALMNKSPKCLN